MGLRDRLKQKIRAKVAPMRDAGMAAMAAERGARRAGAGARRGATVLREQLEQAEPGEIPKEEEDEGIRSQAERAQRFAMMSPPGKARLQPIDVPHPYEDQRAAQRDARDQRPRDRQREPTMEDLVLGREQGRQRDDDPLGLVFGDRVDDDGVDEFEGGLLNFDDSDRRR